MQGPSRQAHAAFDDRLDAALAAGAGSTAGPSAETAVAAGDRAATIGESLFAFAGLLRNEPLVRRAVTDPGRPPDDREALVRRLVGDRLDPAATDLVTAAVRDRWASPRDLITAVEEFGVVAYLAAADQRGQLDSVEDEVFRFGQLVKAEPGLRNALVDQAAPLPARRDVVRRLLGDRASPETLSLVDHVVVSLRHRRIEAPLERIGELAAERRERRVAVVRTATPLTPEHRQRLEQALSAQAGRRVRLNVVVEPGLVGGMMVEMGDDVVDGTIRSRLAELNRRLGNQ